MIKEGTIKIIGGEKYKPQTFELKLELFKEAKKEVHENDISLRKFYNNAIEFYLKRNK